MLSRVSKILTLLVLMPLMLAAAAKRDFRGVWIQTIYQGYDKRSTAENQTYLSALLDNLQACGINCIFFQVRPWGDALYDSNIEPWSAALTGHDGTPPMPHWDPLLFMVNEAHRRGMELHAWLNPYRAPAVGKKLSAKHPAKLHPERFVTYGKARCMDPALPENRTHICSVVRDILTRYDVDGIHFDDYFYPYPIAKLQFPDFQSFKRSKTTLSPADWRRQNTELLIEAVSHTLAQVKPWARFGVSPFGIWRNQRTDASGSKTTGLQTFDDLFADPLAWDRRGLVDYIIPQLYWELNHRVAPYFELCQWWGSLKANHHIYIGEDAEKVLKYDELDPKMLLAESQPAIQGHCWWYAAALPSIAAELRSKHYSALALVPEYPWKNLPEAPAPKVRCSQGSLTWTPDPKARKWVVYHFKHSEPINLENPQAILGVTYSPSFAVAAPGTYVVTALNHANIESKASNKIEI